MYVILGVYKCGYLGSIVILGSSGVFTEEPGNTQEGGTCDGT